MAGGILAGLAAFKESSSEQTAASKGQALRTSPNLSQGASDWTYASHHP